MPIIFVLVLIFFGFMFWNLFKAVDSCFDHCSWRDGAKPDINAHIIDVHSNEVQYLKNGAKYETTVLFSDGFEYKTCKTNRKQHLLSYTISVDQELLSQIVSEAKRKHAEAVEKHF